MKNIKCYIAFKIINIGISILPKQFQSNLFIDNCMHTKILKVKHIDRAKGGVIPNGTRYTVNELNSH